ncbi:MAG: tRNA uridine-5-carboxymethylaminomethyl(34) synthesis enzyme MnmG, partial [Pseudomonadota bacterium]
YPERHEAYIGVLIDDLVTRGVSEPYRMFTSRAEYRLTLREDNADLRLTETGRELGLVDDERWATYTAKREAVAAEQARLSDITVRAGTRLGADEIGRETRADALLKRPGVSYADVAAIDEVGTFVDVRVEFEELREQVVLQLETQAKYAGYIERQSREIEKHAKQDALRLPVDIDYAAVDGLSNEAREKLERARPATIGQASRLEGMTPSAVSLLLIHLKKRTLKETA